MRRRPSAMRTLQSRAVEGGMSYDVELDTKPERVPGTLLVPNGDCPPVVLMLHGAGSDRARMSDSIGRALLGHGVASLSIDLPMHGGREGDVRDLSIHSPLEVVRAWKLAVAEAREAIWILGDDHRFNSGAIGIVGYSLGAYLATIVAGEEEGIRAIVLAAGGDLPARIPFAGLVRTVADPLRAVRRIAGRPLLMVNGRYDRTIVPAQAEALFTAAGDPKTIEWYNGGHWPPPRAIERAAAWLSIALTSPAAERAPCDEPRSSRSRTSAVRR